MNMGKKTLALFCALALTVSMTACGKPEVKRDPQGMAYFSYFDTVSYVYSYAEDSAEEFEARSAEVSAVLYRYHQLFDIYHEYSGINNLCTVNRLAGGEPVTVVSRRRGSCTVAIKDGRYNMDMQLAEAIKVAL